MDESELRKITSQGETLTVEFKRAQSRKDLNDTDIVEAVVGLANGKGGQLFIGVEDDGTITGTAPRGRSGERLTPHLLAAMILNKTIDPLSVDVELITIDDKDVYIVTVPQAASPVCTSSGTYKRRSLRVDGTPQCLPYAPSLLVSAALTFARRDYAEAPLTGISEDDLDDNEFDRFRRFAATEQGDSLLQNATNDDLMRALRVRGQDGRLTVGALLLFGRSASIRDHLPTVETLLQIDHRGSLAVNQTAHDPLFKTATNMFDTVMQYNDTTEVMTGLFRVDIARVPETLIRESVVNALVHRDYAELGAIQVKLTDDDFRVSSPGGLPGGLTLTNLLDETRPRSPLLAEAFKRAGLVERTGRGIARMYETLLRSGRGNPDYSATEDRRVIIRANTSDTDAAMVRFVTQWENQQAKSLSLNKLRGLHALNELGVSCTAVEVRDELVPPMSGLRHELTALVKAGLVDSRGAGASRRYVLSAAFFRLAKDPNAYIRVSSTDASRHQRMVLDYVEQYGRITRADVSDLCLLTAAQSRALLRRMTESGELHLHGERRWAYYTTSPASEH